MKKLIRLIGVCVFGLVMLVLVSACAGVTQSPNGTVTSATITGTIQSVNASNHSVTLNVNGQSFTINGLTDQQIAALQNQAGKTYTIHVTRNPDGSYNISPNTNPQENDTATPGVQQTETPGAPAAGNISFIGKVQSVNNSSISVSMPDGKVLSMNIVSGQTDLGENGVLPTVGQLIKVKAITNSDGSFMAKSLKVANSNDTQDQNVVDYQGVTTSAVGSDNVLHFRVGNQDFSYTLSGTTQVKDFINVQAIGANQPVKVTVQFNGSTPVVLKVQNGND